MNAEEIAAKQKAAKEKWDALRTQFIDAISAIDDETPGSLEQAPPDWWHGMMEVQGAAVKSRWRK